MVKAKLILLSAALLSLNACCNRPAMEWERLVMDAHRTGVTAATANNVEAALGSVADGVYYAPDGKEFKGSATVLTADVLISAQQVMAPLREVVGFTCEEMSSHFPESTLSNWAVDLIASSVAELSGRRIDVGILNFGGIRVDFPKGEILLDEVRSMFPFKNHLAYVELEGKDLLYLIEKMVSENNLQALSGVRMTVTDGVIDSLLVQGAEIDPKALYGIATIDFLLDGGDNLKVARNARDLKIFKEIIIDVVEPYVRKCYAEGIPVSYHTDGRVVIKNSAE